MEVIKYIHERLGCGKIEISKDKISALICVSDSKSLVEKVFPIFDTVSLNTTKMLDYLVFKKVFTQCKQKKHLTPEGLDYITKLINSYNKSRTDFTMPSTHTLTITPY